MRHIKNKATTRLSLTAGLFVTVLALAQSTEPGRMHQSCHSLGKNWTNFNCPFDPDQRRCLGLEIAYEASPECAEVTRLNGSTLSFTDFPQFHNPAFGALDHYFKETMWYAGDDWAGDPDACVDVCENVQPPELSVISPGCCMKLCANANGHKFHSNIPPGSSCAN